MVIFHSYVNVCQRVNYHKWHFPTEGIWHPSGSAAVHHTEQFARTLAHHAATGRHQMKSTAANEPLPPPKKKTMLLETWLASEHCPKKKGQKHNRITSSTPT